MSKYEISEAIMLKECMKRIAAIKVKHPSLELILRDGIEEDLKNAIEFIQEMVEKKVS